MVQKGESITGIEAVSAGTATTVNVPSGEVWKFTHVSATSSDGSFAGNYDIAVGVSGTSTVNIAFGASDAPVVGGDGNGTSTRSVVVDGSNVDFNIYNDGSRNYNVYWSATRITDEVTSGLVTFSSSGNKVGAIPSDTYRIVTAGGGFTGSTGSPANTQLSLGYYDGSHNITYPTSASDTPLISGSSATTDYAGTLSHFPIDGSKHDLTIKSDESSIAFYYAAIKV